ncbi:MAG: potassium-transporting ATPase subunit A, partial [Chloroflexi bacterium HGW-Chloroflexi-10]
MTLNGWVQIFLFLAVLLLFVKPLGLYMAKVYSGEHTFLKRIIAPAERVIYRLTGVNPLDEMDWKNYSRAFLMFSVISFVFLYSIQRIQSVLPFNPVGLVDVSRDLAFNTAVSFVSNTNWQNYGGETTMSFLTQMVGLSVQNFVSAAAGMSVLVAFVRGLSRQKTSLLGNFWVDMTRGVLYILIPLAFIFALLLVSQGVVQTFLPKVTASLIQPAEQNTQLIAVGPAASQIAIKMLGTNGGGFFNVNSSHPLENPTPISNFLEMLAIVLIPAALCYTYGKLIGDTRQGWAILIAMTILLVVFIGLTYAVESQANPLLARLGVDASNTSFQAGGNMEGKEVRFGITNSSLWAVLTTAASNGSVNSMHDSYSPLGGLVLLIMMMFGEVVFGGVGSGLYGMLVFVILAVFIAGLMVGRTPEYLG